MAGPDSSNASLRVGITGHRLARLGEANIAAIRAHADSVLNGIAGALTANGGGTCCLISNMADGADSIVADAALALGWQLDAVLPFPREQYRPDFAAGPLRAAFDGHLAAADRCFELPGVHDGKLLSTAAYERAGRVVLTQCDLLIGVWDGKPAQGRGGAAQIIAEAVDNGIAVILIDPAGKRAPELLWDGLDEVEQGRQDIDTVPRGSLDRLGELVGFHTSCPADQVGDQLRADFEKGKPVRGAWLGLAYPLLVKLFGAGGRQASQRHSQDFAASMLSAEAQAALRLPFDRADSTANAAGRLFRSGYVCNFSLAALAVLLSMMGLALPAAFKPVLIVLEVLTIGAILVITRLGNRWHWHRRWLDNRHLAERLRCLEISVQLGDLGLRTEVSQHSGWAGWFARAAARKAGLPDRRVDESYLATVKSGLINLLDEQITYLGADAKRMHRIEHRLHQTGTALFGATAAICVILLGVKLSSAVPALEALGERLHPLLTAGTILSAVLPAIGAAIYGIRMQGDFAGTSERDEALCEQLAGLRRVIAVDAPDYDSLQRRSRRVTSLLTADQANWLRTYHARPLTLPG